MGTDDRSEFIPTNMRLGASLMVPIDEYNKFSISADANKLLVPTYPQQEDGESTEAYQERVQKDYYDVSSIAGIFKSFGDAPADSRRSCRKCGGVSAANTPTTTGSASGPATTTRVRIKVTASTSPSELDSR